MKSVSANFKAAQASNLIYPVRKIELFRRLANGSGWEATPIDVTTEVAMLDRLSWKLDTDALNEFKTSNITIQVDNSQRQWDDGSATRFSGFLRYHSKLRISLGLTVAGAAEIFPSYTGVIEEALEDSATPTLKLSVLSIDQLLDGANADNAAIQVVNELLGVGDGITSQFTLSQTPVGIIKEVRVGGVASRPGIRWTSSGLADPTKKAVVVFNSIAPASGQEVRADYVVWKRDQQIQQVAKDILATVPQVDQLQVDTVSFSPPAQREILHTTTGDFLPYSLARAKIIAEPPPPDQDAGITMDAYDTVTKWLTAIATTRINTTRVVNGIAPKWTSQYEADLEPGVEKYQIDGDPAFPWQEALPSGSTATNSGSIRNIIHNGGSDYFLWNDNDDGGQYQPTPYPARSACCRIKFSAIGGGGIYMETYVRVSSSSTLGAKLRFVNMGHVQVFSGSVNNPQIAVDLSQFHTFRLTMTPTSATAATYQLFIDGVSVQTGNLAVQSVFSAITLHSIGGGNNIFLDWLRYNAVAGTPASGQLTLKVDYGPVFSGLVAFSLINTLGNFFADIQGSASGAQFFWSWSADDFIYSGETAVANSGNIGAWNNTNSPRYIKFRIVLTDTLEAILPYGIKRLWLPALAVSEPVDGGTGIVSWDTWTSQMTLNNGTIQRFTAAFGGTQFITGSGYSFDQALGPNNAIQTDKFQSSQGFGITQQMVFIALMNTPDTNPPTLLLNLIDLTTSTVLISMASMNSRSALDVLKELASIADFEIGMDGSGKFFFRNKSPAATAVATLNDSNIEIVQSVSTGWDRVFNTIRATYGGFVKVADSVSEADPAPTSVTRFGVKPLNLSGGQLLFEADVDLATMMAKRYFGRYKEPKRRIVLIARFMPELDLGDRVTFSLFIPRQIGQPFDTRILGIAHDLMNFRTELDLLEI